MALLAALPLVVVLALMLGARWSAGRAGAAGLMVALLLGLFAFDLPTAPGGAAGAIGGALAEATFTALTILWIIVPALAIHSLQVAGGAVDELRAALGRLAGDQRLTGLLVAWFFALLIEGAAGFGTAAALAAPTARRWWATRSGCPSARSARRSSSRRPRRAWSPLSWQVRRSSTARFSGGCLSAQWR